MKAPRTVGAIVVTLVLSAAVAPGANGEPGDFVAFGSAAIEHCVQEALGLGSTEAVPRDEFASLTSLDCETYQVESLTGLEAATRLERLRLYANFQLWGVPEGDPGRDEYLDTYFSPIGALGALRELEISSIPQGVNAARILEAPIETIAVSVGDSTATQGLGWLSGSTTLKGLSVWASGQQVDVAPLASLTTLERLRFERFASGSATSLASLINLQTLELPGANLTDWNALTTLTDLRAVDLSNSNVDAVDWLGGAPLTWLSLDETTVTDLDVLADATALEYASLRGLGIEHINFLADHGDLSELHLDDNQITSLAPLADSTGLVTLTLDNNEVEDISVLSTLPALTTVRLDHNRVTDVSPLASLPMLGDWSAHDERGTLPPIAACVQHTMTAGTDIDGTARPLVARDGVYDEVSFVVPFNGAVSLRTRGGSNFSATFESEAYGHDEPCPWPEEYLPTMSFPSQLVVGQVASIELAAWGTRRVEPTYRWTVGDGTDSTYTRSVIPLASGIGSTVTPSAITRADGMATVIVSGEPLTVLGVLPEDIGLQFVESPTAGMTAAPWPLFKIKDATWTCEWILNGVTVPTNGSCSWAVPTSAIGKSLVVRATASKTNYLPRTYVSAPEIVLRNDWKVRGKGSISGTPDVGKVLTAVPPAFTPSPTAYSYVWMRDSWAIDGANAKTYTLTAADAGKKISVVIYGERAGYLRTSVETPMVSVKKYFTSKPTPAVSGTMAVGYTLTATKGTWSPAPTSYKYQWYRAGKAISGATKSTYKTVTADGGHTITVKVTATKSGYTTTSKTSASVMILKALTSKPTPTITGTAKVKSTLTAKSGTWGPGTVTKSYQWYRNGKAISGATKSTYKVSVKDAYASITVKVTGKKAGYLTASRTSKATKPLGIKYANCTDLKKDYPGGVAKSSSTKNLVRGVAEGGILSTTYVSSSLYSLNASRDADKDGWACE
ncbi:excalibur calcium-binding domain-containing protein [Demequina sp.]|uniref:excalibur calcium-binding domain-containing protein n=1 Tax=Demequina sp. TaxID=2050685 RepID=UPI003D12DAEB